VPLREPDEPFSTRVAGGQWLVDIDVPTGIREPFHQRQVRAGCRVDEHRRHAGIEECLELGVAVGDAVGVADAVELGAITGEEVQLDIGPGGEDGQVRLLRDVAKADHANAQRWCRDAVPGGVWHPHAPPFGHGGIPPVKVTL
jgi:hypothetical protein